MIRRCMTCRYLHEGRELKEGEWNKFDLCTVFPQTGNEGYSDFALVIKYPTSDVCEMWEERK